MPTPTEQLLSRTSYLGDGATTDWNFTFSSGYLDKAHVKAYTQSPAGVRTNLTVLPGNFLGPYQLRITPAVASGYKLTIYRDTPKDAPLVDFTDGSNFQETSLDTLAKQAVFVAAESYDALGLVVGPAFQATAEQVALDAATAVAAAAQAEAAKLAAQAAAASAVDDAEALLLAAIQPYLNTAAASAATSTAQAGVATAQAGVATAAASNATAAANTVQAIAGAFVGTFGFTGPAYDFGFVSDTTTYLDLDCGTVP